MSYLWAAAAGITAIVLETIFKKTSLAYYQLWWLWPGALAMNFCVYKIIKTTDSMLTGFIVFTTTTAVLRLVSALIIARERPGKWTYAALGLMLIANILKKL